MPPLESLRGNSSAPLMQTPSSELPASRAQWRFRPVRGAAEWIEEYRPGGYHPVELGDMFNGKYKIVRKLGYGSYSTVWLARDICAERNVAVKILKASIENSRELDILSHLTQQGSGGMQTGSTHVLKLLDHFQHVGPNGRHLCLVTEALGPSVGDLLEMPGRNIRDSTRYEGVVVREISKQALLGLAYIHKAAVIHGDTYGGNLLFAIPGLDIATEGDILSDLHQPIESEPVLRIDGLCPEGGDPWAPRKLLYPQPLRGTKARSRVDLTNPVIKFTDFGGAFKFADQSAPRPMTPAPFRAPERIVLMSPLWTESIDIWGLGCLIFSLITNSPLVQLDGLDDEDNLDDDHLLQLHEVIGPLPQLVTRNWARYNVYFDNEGHQRRNTPLSAEISFGEVRKPLRQHLLESRPEGMTAEEVEDLYTMLRKMLAYDPVARLSAEELLKEPWLDGSRY